MRYLVFIAGLATCVAVTAADTSSWLTVVGDPGKPQADIVEVDVSSAVAFESLRKVRLRVNRAETRRDIDGEPYQSYYSTALVDCTDLKAWHRSLSLFDKPLWSGKMRTVDYAETEGHELTFGDMQADPKDRLTKAACSIAVQAH